MDQAIHRSCYLSRQRYDIDGIVHVFSFTQDLGYNHLCPDVTVIITLYSSVFLCFVWGSLHSVRNALSCGHLFPEYHHSLDQASVISVI